MWINTNGVNTLNAQANPYIYELTGDVINKQAEARYLCSGCPVVQQCAKAALAAPSVGLVRAGQWIPLQAGSHMGYSQVWVDVLTMIAEGEA